jgi:hypothetical protein
LLRASNLGAMLACDPFCRWNGPVLSTSAILINMPLPLKQDSGLAIFFAVPVAGDKIGDRDGCNST